MDQTFLDRLQKWHEDDCFQQIIDAIEALPEEEQSPDLISQLARAYNNLAGPRDHHLLQRAVDLLHSVEEDGKDDHNWNYRLAYAYFYLDKEYLALPYFRRALELRPGDEDTLEFIEQCQDQLVFPSALKPFRLRAQEGWESFLEGEAELRRCIDEQREGKGDGDALVALCNRLLAPAFESVAFELGHNGEKYELILTPEGNLPLLFQLVYFKSCVPAELLENWIITVGRTRSGGFALRMFGQEISAANVSVWVEALDGNKAGLSLYCEGLLPLLRENEDQAYSLMAILLDQAIGELAAMRYVGYMDLLDAPMEGECILLDGLTAHLQTQIDPEGFAECDSAEGLCERYTAYRMEPAEGDNLYLREDVFAGVTTCTDLINLYFRGDDQAMDRFHRDGVVAGFLYYPLDGIDKDEILNLRDALQAAIEEEAGAEAVTFLGGATGTVFGYLDFIAWDLRAVLNAAVKALADLPLERAAYHSFRRDVSGLTLKSPEEDEA